MNYFQSIREYVTPVLKVSNFENGMLTPQEFVQAGDGLVFTCPTWKWCSGVKKKRASMLPTDKQYLVTRNVPCLERCSSHENIPEMQDGEWTVYEGKMETIVEIHGNNETNEVPEIDIEMKEVNESKFDSNEGSEENMKDLKDISSTVVDGNIEINENTEEVEDLEFIDNDDDDFDPAAILHNDKILKTRTYDVYISYDNYYRTPRVWLFGYDEKGNILGYKEMFEDVSPEHAKKTVTYEYHPHEQYMALSVHPCKHASVMKKLLKRSSQKNIRPDQYLFIFLKFIGSVIPTITYDYSITM